MNNKERNNKKEEKEERKRQIEENEKPATGLGGTGVRRPQFPRFVSCQARGGALVHTADGFGRKHIILDGKQKEKTQIIYHLEIQLQHYFLWHREQENGKGIRYHQYHHPIIELEERYYDC